MFRKYSWLIYVFIIAFLLPGNFICLWGLKIRKPVVIYIIPDKKDPLNQFGLSYLGEKKVPHPVPEVIGSQVCGVQ